MGFPMDFICAGMAYSTLTEYVAADIVPIAIERELMPISVKQTEEGFLYDFGEDNAGVCRLTIQGYTGQVISLYYAEMLRNGKLNRRNIAFDENDYVQKDIYICKGDSVEQYKAVHSKTSKVHNIFMEYYISIYGTFH